MSFPALQLSDTQRSPVSPKVDTKGVTILTRLTAKGLVERHKHGRAFLYRVTMSEADVLAARMRAALAAAGDPDATLSRFVASLSPREADALQQVLGGMKHRRRS